MRQLRQFRRIIVALDAVVIVELVNRIQTNCLEALPCVQTDGYLKLPHYIVHLLAALELEPTIDTEQ